MRCDELIRLKCEFITFNAESMVFRIVSSKSQTDQYWEGSSLIIACTGGANMPCWYDGEVFPYGELENTPKECVFRGYQLPNTENG